jgi:beta-lactamase superfamily II metal-dependent hydrolase
LIVLLTLVTISVSANQLNTIQVSFINVGQGDSALIQDGNGFDVLIDGGKASAGPTVVAYIREQGVDWRQDAIDVAAPRTRLFFRPFATNQI